MLDSLRSFFQKNAAPPPPGSASDEPVRVAACALLLEIAHSDGDFSDAEREHIERALASSFDISEEKARALIEQAEAERRQAIDLHQFTSLIVKHYDEGQRYVLAELLWRVVLADGELSRHEDTLLYKLARLLDLRPGYLAGIRKQS